MQKNQSRWLLAGIVGAVLCGGVLRTVTSAQGKTSASKTAPKTPVKVASNREVATLAGGCFWSMEAIFKQLKGVEKVEPGYAGGKVKNPKYEQVGTGQTGHAESLQIIYDPKVISYRELLEVMLNVHDPTTRDKQGADEGPQYRSIIFFHNAGQQQAAREVIKKIGAAHVWKNPIVTQVSPFSNFYRAEDYHFDYYNLHSDEPYCRMVVAPKVAKFREKFKSKLKS